MNNRLESAVSDVEFSLFAKTEIRVLDLSNDNGLSSLVCVMGTIFEDFGTSNLMTKPVGSSWMIK